MPGASRSNPLVTGVKLADKADRLIRASETGSMRFHANCIN